MQAGRHRLAFYLASRHPIESSNQLTTRFAGYRSAFRIIQRSDNSDYD